MLKAHSVMSQILISEETLRIILRTLNSAWYQWLIPVILATQEAEIRRIVVQSQCRQTVCESLSQKYPTRKGMVEWLKEKALSSSPSTAK
jgi:hypothetical protein